MPIRMDTRLRSFALAALTVGAALLTGCAGPAPNYAPSVDNVEALKKSGIAPTHVGMVTVATGMPGASEIGIRAHTMVSPVGGHYGEYLAQALRSELQMAKLYDANSTTVVSGTLTRNTLDTSSFSMSSGAMAARFMVKQGDTVRYNKEKSVQFQWPGAFIGAEAIPAAVNNYPVLVRKLITELITDPDFTQALKN